MKHILALFASSALLFSLNASEKAPQIDENRYPYIVPIAVESIAQIDTDKDGVVDLKDRCPDTPLGIVVDADGCELDSDGDGVVDSKDRCPDTPEGRAVDADGCEPVCELDSDGDGVVDSKDKCPNTPQGRVVNGDGCQLDSDRDGVIDFIDECPDTPKGFQVDAVGCPHTATLSVHFPTDGYALSSSVTDEVRNFAEFLKENSAYDVIISGHTDSTGSEEHNKILSQNRANSVKTAISQLGVDESRLLSVGKASTQPVADNATKDGRAQNRRIDVELIKKY